MNPDTNSSKSGLLLANPDVRFYEQVKCPLAFGFSSPSALREIAVAGVGGVWEARVVGGISKRRVFSTALGWRFCFVALLTDPPHQVRSVIHTQPPVRVLAPQHSAARQRTAPAHPIHLQDPLAHRQSVVPVHHALVLHREDALQVFPASRRKRALRLRRRHRKAPVELRQVTLPQKAVGFFHRGDPAQPQLLRQTPLPGAEVPLAASPCLRRIRRNHLHPQIPQPPPHFRHPLPVHPLPALWPRTPRRRAPPPAEVSCGHPARRRPASSRSPRTRTPLPPPSPPPRPCGARPTAPGRGLGARAPRPPPPAYPSSGERTNTRRN